MYKFIVGYFFLLLTINIHGQFEISGTVVDEQGNPLYGATIRIIESSINKITNAKGEFEISQIYLEKYQLEISYVGYVKQLISVTHANKKLVSLNIIMLPSSENLREVVVRGKSKEQEKREQPIKIEVLAVNKISERATALPQIINQTSGVKIRQRGGVGSPIMAHINGLQGKSIRFFKNDIPSDYLGRSFDISLVPTNLISDVEIYKGVLPISFGADALGGAINIVAQKPNRSFLNMAYEWGSFNTHIANVNANYLVPNSKVNIGFNGYYVGSDNDYRFTAPVLDSKTQNFKEQSVNRFHDGIESYFMQATIGISDISFADAIRIEASHFNWSKEAQVGNSISIPIGEATFKESSNVFSLSYKKNIFSNTEIDLFVAYSKINIQREDVSNNKYNWLGEITSFNGFTTGEIQDRKSDSDVDKNSYVFRFYGSNTINPNFNIKLSSTLNQKKQVGTDLYQEKNFITGIQPITIPATYKKLVSGIGIGNTFFDKKLSNEFTVKHFFLKTESTDAFVLNTTEKKETSSWGWGNSLKYSFNENVFARISYEHTTRIPDAEEYFGDNLFNLSNPGLLPEKSKNLNLGFYGNLNAAQTLFLDVNLFYRKSENFIRNLPQGFIFTRHENTDAQLTKGIETTLKLKTPNNFSANLVITYQDMRRVDTNSTSIENSRTPNAPYFFANVNAIKIFQKPFGLKILAEVYTSYGFTEQYLLRATSKNLEPALFERDLEFTDLIIPEQHLLDFGVTIKLQELPLSINGEISNITNSKLFDEFRIQKPLRAFKLKMTYKL